MPESKCEILPLWHPNDEYPSYEQDCHKEVAARKMYREVANSIVQIDADYSEATGFFVQDGDEIMTNAHVAALAGVEPLKITTNNYNIYTAYIEAVDEVNDLAVLKVQGLAPGKYTPLQFRPSKTVQPGEPVFIGAHPSGRMDVIISLGEFQRRGPFIDFYNDGPIKDRMVALLNSPDTQIHTRAELELHAPRLGSNAIIESGSSGGPEFDSEGMVIGVAANKVPKLNSSRGLAVPSEAAIRLLNLSDRSRTPKFEYQVPEIEFRPHPIDYLTGHGQPKLVGDPVKRLGY